MDYAKIKKEYQDSKFSVEGEWWPDFAIKDSRIEEMKVRGRLIYNPEDGAFLSLNFKNGNQWGSPIIHGKAKDEFGMEQEYTCLHPSYHDGRPDSMTYKVDLVIKGALLNQIDAACFNGVDFSLKNINSWVKSSGFSLEGKDFWASFTINYKRHASEWTNLTDKFEFRISQSAFPMCEPNNREINKISSRENVTINIRTHGSNICSINDLLDWIPIFVDFFTISANDICSPHSIYIHGNTASQDTNENNLSGQVFLSNNSYSNNAFESHKYNFIFCEEDLEHSIGEHLSSWISNYDKVITQVSLLKGTLCGNQYIESEFLTLCQAVESYHRNVQQGQFIEQDTYDNVIYPILIGAIPEKLDASFKESLKTRFKYANEFSLRKRLTLLIKQHSYLFDKRIKTTDGLASRIADARNYFTHYAQDTKQTHEYPIGFYSIVLRSILTVSLLTLFGFSSEKIKTLSEKYELFNNIKYSAPWSLRPEDTSNS